MAELKIGQLARRLDLNAQTIRYYERIGILPAPERTESGYRAYGEEDERRLRFVKNARSVGLSLGEIKEILAFNERGEAPCEYVTEAISRRTEEVERQISDLTQFKAELEGLYERARQQPAREPSPGSYCHIIEGGASGVS